MNLILHKNLFLVKEHVGLFKAANNYDIYDPETGEKIMECREENLGIFTKLFRFTKYKRMTPFHIVIRGNDGRKVLSVDKNMSWFLSKVFVRDENDQPAGFFKQKLLSIGGKFDVYDHTGLVVCQLKGNWTGWDFKFEKDGKVFAEVKKKWAGIGKEFFTSADNYMLSISEEVPKESKLRVLILAAVMCIDMVLKE